MLKLKDGFIMREIGGDTMVLHSGEELDLNMMITLNDTGAFLWEQLQNDCTEADLVAALLADYDVDESTARECVESFVKKLSDHDFLV